MQIVLTRQMSLFGEVRLAEASFSMDRGHLIQVMSVLSVFIKFVCV